MARVVRAVTGLLLVAVALPLLPWTLGAGPSGLGTAGIVALLMVSAAAYAGTGLGALWSGREGEAVDAPLGTLGRALWFWLPGPALAWLAVRACGWGRAAAILLVLASPVVMFVSYAVGSFDAAPWYEAICGDLTAAAGLCLVVAAVRRPRRQPGTPLADRTGAFVG